MTSDKPNIIHVRALGLIWREPSRHLRELLLERIHEPDGTLIGYRPLGGKIDFGEKSWEALEREFMEELGEDVKIKRLFDVHENLYVWGGQPGHEISFIYEAEFLNKIIYTEDVIERIDTSTADSRTKTAYWIDPFDLADGLVLFPAGLADKLKEKRDAAH